MLGSSINEIGRTILQSSSYLITRVSRVPYVAVLSPSKLYCVTIAIIAEKAAAFAPLFNKLGHCHRRNSGSADISLRRRLIPRQHTSHSVITVPCDNGYGVSIVKHSRLRITRRELRFQWEVMVKRKQFEDVYGDRVIGPGAIAFIFEISIALLHKLPRPRPRLCFICI